MKPEELMIGDWVLMKDKPYKVASLSSIGNPELESDKYIFHCLKDEIAPIPLTSEILKKNGFKFYCTDVFEEWKSKDKRITIHDEEYPNSFNKWAVHVDTEDMRTMGYFEITYVHELQHTLRLFGLNKEIEV